MKSLHVPRRAAALGLLGSLLAVGAARGEQRGVFGADQVDLDRLDSEYNTIVVRRIGGQVFMMFVVGRCEFVETIYEPARPEVLPVEYTRYVTAALAYPNRVRSLLEIGLGGGRTVSYLHRFMPNLAITAVEIDPGVVALARRHFGLREDSRLRVVVDDGRRYAQTTRARYDAIIVDAYRGTFVPETLTTVEFFTLLKARLNPGGVVAQNVEPTTLFYDAMAATLKAVFDNVDAYPTGRGTANSVLVAYDGPSKTQAALAARAAALQRLHQFTHAVPELLAVRTTLEGPFRAAPLRDQFNPANELLAIDRANDRNTPRQRREQCL